MVSMTRGYGNNWLILIKEMRRLLSKLKHMDPDKLNTMLKEGEYEQVRIMSLRLRDIVEPEKIPPPPDY